MRKLFVITFALVLAVVCVSGQTGSTTEPASSIGALPNNFAGAGMGFQSTASPQASGWAEACNRNPDIKLLGVTVPSYKCVATDYSSLATSARVDFDTVLYHRGWFAGGSKTGGGASYNGNGVGAALTVGGWVAVDISKWVKVNGAYATFSGTWQKSDVAVATEQNGVGPVLQALGSHGVYRFGFGKVW